MPTGRHIVCISSIDWDFIWQGHQEIMSRFAAAGHTVLFIENMGVRTPRLSDMPRMRHRLRNRLRGVQGFREERPGLFVFSPVVLPFPYSRMARWVNRTMLMRALRRWMRATGFGRPIVWTFLPTPTARDLVRELDPEVTIYYCIDDFASSSPTARRIGGSEIELFREADLVFVTSERLRERAARTSRTVHLFPFGVSFEVFDAARRAAAGPPDDMRELPRPVIGYVGGIHQWVDQEILAGLARAMPEATVLLVGPVQADVSALAGLHNVHLLGTRAHGEIPRYIAAFDVTLVPYRRTEYTANVYPTKLNEYLAMGKAVVATDLTEIRRFNAEHGDIVAVASDADGFVEAIRQHLAKPEDPADVERRISVARSNSWTLKMNRMATLIDSAIARRRAAGARWQDVLRRSYRRGRRRVAVMVLGLLGTYGLVFETPVVWWLAKPLRVAEAPRHVDAIVVFAGGVGESGKSGGGYQERVARAVMLYREGWATRLVFSSGYVFAFGEAEVMRDLAIGQGVPAEAITLETRAASTYENVAFSARILAEEGRRSVLLVTSPYHTRRATLTWRTVAPAIEVVPVPVLSSQFYTRGRGPSLEQIQGIVHEYAAIVAYWWRGWIR
jgi:uncharacterized SAM-binding protein YcdF (DUF218 family)/glycosyltransferase involved in cell wall biosynthesis